jgi:glucosamine-6-phosphate deaminase
MLGVLGGASLIAARQLDEWIDVPVDELAARARIPFVLAESRADVHRIFADDLWEEFQTARDAGREISVIIPLGPSDHFPILARRVNEEKLPLDHVSFFGMDEWLDWQGRPFPHEHPYSLEGRFHELFVDRIDEKLRPRPENVIFPTPLALDRSSEELARRANLVGTYGGVGFQGHIAFNEPPASRWTSVSVDELHASRTRVVPLAIDTIIAHAQRSAGGNVYAVPPMAITLGMRDLLAAPRVRLYIDTGAWKRTILRILLFSDADADYPATLVHGHPDVRVVADRDSAAPPLRAAGTSDLAR